MEAATDEATYRAALELLKQTTPEAQVALKETAKTAKARCIPTPVS